MEEHKHTICNLFTEPATMALHTLFRHLGYERYRFCPTCGAVGKVRDGRIVWENDLEERNRILDKAQKWNKQVASEPPSMDI
jgi:hypothetical protein